jgi:hypothetical protein
MPMRNLTWLTAIAVLMALPAQAQNTSTVPNADPALNPQGVNNRNDPFGANGSSGGGLSITNLIHQSNLANSRTPEQVNRDQNRSIDDAVTRFRSTEVRITPESLSTNPPKP